ncbi:hypothetical protein [Variovorax sp. GT1P44]|uniref:hypothetical protein n=1 Tax=Variovorax sp. GT1P44 TaxID=3443742 RepID=UPI003F4608C3
MAAFAEAVGFDFDRRARIAPIVLKSGVVRGQGDRGDASKRFEVVHRYTLFSSWARVKEMFADQLYRPQEAGPKSKNFQCSSKHLLETLAARTDVPGSCLSFGVLKASPLASERRAIGYNRSH